MRQRAVAHARWHSHSNGVSPARAIRRWLVDSGSLTVKLTACCSLFRVRRLQQARSVCLADEFGALRLARRTCVRQREVLLQCDGRAMVYAHTAMPLRATAADWPSFGSLGERSLGTTLFGDPRVRRGALQFARLRAMHPLARRARAALGEELALPLLARRCLYRRGNGLLLVTEVFLPALADLDVPAQRPAATAGLLND